MYQKLIHTFLISLFLFFALFQGFFKYLAKIEEKRDSRRTAVLLESTIDRFREFLELPLSVSEIGSDYLADKDLLKTDYGPLYQKFLSTNDDVSGINLVNHDGEIIKVYPEKTNQHTIGKYTQNIIPMKASLTRGEKFWVSPPFQLFQGEQGFVIYVPISQGKNFKGWIATVISTKKFAEKFQGRQFIKDYDLIVKDELTNQTYFTTGISPGDQAIYRAKANIYGRGLVFESWKKEAAVGFHFSWEISLALSFLLSLLTSYTRKLYLQKKRASSQLQDISTLLSMTAREAVNNLISEQMKRQAPEGHIQYLTDLVEQIELLQTMSLSKSTHKTETTAFLPLLKRQLENLSPGIEQKHLQVIFDEERLKSIHLHVNVCLFQNSVVSNILGHCLVHAAPNTKIRIETTSDEDKHYILFHPEKINEDSATAMTFDRRMDVARKVLQIYEGELYMQRDLAQGMIIRIILPH